MITHRVRLAEAPSMYGTFREKKNGCINIVIEPQSRS